MGFRSLLCGLNPKKKEKKRKKKPCPEENVVEEENANFENIERQNHAELQQPKVKKTETTPQQRSGDGSQQPTQPNERNLEDEVSSSEEQLSREESNHPEDNNRSRESHRSTSPGEEETRSREERIPPTSPQLNVTINNYTDNRNQYRFDQHDNRTYNDNRSYYHIDNCPIETMIIQSDKNDENNPRNNSSNHNSPREEGENIRTNHTQVESDQIHEVFSSSSQGECEDKELAPEVNDFIQINDENQKFPSILKRSKNDSTSKYTGKLFEASSIEYIDATDDEQSLHRFNSDRQTSSKKTLTKKTKPFVPSRTRLRSEQTQKHPLQLSGSEYSDCESNSKSFSHCRLQEAKKRSRSLPSKTNTRKSSNKERDSCSNENSEKIEMGVILRKAVNPPQDSIDDNGLTTKKQKTSL